VVDPKGNPVTVTTLSFATLTVSNFGPNDVILDSIVLGRSGGRWRRIKTDFPSPWVLPSPDMRMVNDYEQILPQKLEVGDCSTIEFPINDTYFEGVEFIGVLDTFGRNHWCGPRQVERISEQLRGR
jgi:hypothetical protein